MSKTYKLTPDFFVKLQKRFYFVVFPILLILVFAGAFLGLMKSEVNFCSMATVPVIFIFMAFSFRKTLIQQKRSWASYQLRINADLISRTQDDFDTIQISKNEISKITDYSGKSIVVLADTAKKQIAIPASLENFSEVRELLSQWRTIEVAESKNGQNIFILFFLIALSIIAFAIIILGTNTFFVTVVGSVLVAILVSSVVVIQRGQVYAHKMKRAIWWVFIPIAAIVARLYFLLFAQ